MKKIALIPLLLLLSLVSCKKEERNAPLEESEQAKPLVYASNYPLYYFSNRLAGNWLDLRFPAGALSDPSSWNPPADTIAAMQQADLILLNGAQYESWMLRVSLPEEKMVNTSQPFSTHLIQDTHTFSHSHAGESEHEHQVMATTTWLDLDLAAKQAAEVARALERLIPQHKDSIQQSLKSIESQLEDFHQRYKAITSKQPSPVVAFSHPVYQYLEHAYGINAKSLHWEPDMTLGEKEIHTIEEMKDHLGISYLLWEGTPLPENVETLDKLGIRSLVLNPLGGLPAQGDFMDGLQRNLQVLESIYAPQPSASNVIPSPKIAKR